MPDICPSRGSTIPDDRCIRPTSGRLKRETRSRGGVAGPPACRTRLNQRESSVGRLGQFGEFLDVNPK